MMEKEPLEKTSVLLLFGGKSGEHGIACATAAGVYQAIDQEKYQVTTVGITPEGQWVPVDFDPEDYRIQNGKTAQVEADSKQFFVTPGFSGGLEIDLTQIENSLADKETLLAKLLAKQFDVVLPLLHGPNGEDGTLQGLLEIWGIPYVGCGVLSSAACMDKITTKILLAAAGLPAGKWVAITGQETAQQAAEKREAIKELGLPVFVKPSRAGSSLGVSRVSHWEQLEPAIAAAAVHDPRVIVEAALSGIEVECAVLGPQLAENGQSVGKPRTSCPGQIAMGDSSEFYDYETKYVDTSQVQMVIPAPISPELTAMVKEQAAQAFTALNCEGLARVDFFVEQQTGQVVINEINTMPGFTPYSMYPALWQAEGLSYPQLIDELLKLALARPIGLR